MSLLSKLKDFKKSWEYLAEGMKIDFSANVFGFMQTKGVNRTELARRLGTSQAYVTKVLSGTANPSLETVAKIAHALDADVEIVITEKPAKAITASIPVEVSDNQKIGFWVTDTNSKKSLWKGIASMNVEIAQLPLKLENYFFTDTEVHFVPLQDKSEIYKVSPNIDISTGISEDGSKKQVAVTVQSDSKDSDGKQYNFSFKISVLGTFVNTATEEETEYIRSIIYANAVSMLLGAVREYLLTLTAKGPFAAYVLPALLVTAKNKKA